MKKNLVFILAVFLVAGCAHQPASEFVYNPPGFFSGLFHGFMILPALLGSIFMDIRIYAYPNTGWFYDLGFFIGAAVPMSAALAN